MRRPALVMLGVALLWGTVGTTVREVPLPAAAIAAGRTVIGTIVLGALLGSRQIPGPRLFSVQRARSVAIGVILGGHWLSLMAAYQHMAVAPVIFIVYVAPILVALVAPVT